MTLFYTEKYKESVMSDAEGSASEGSNKICGERPLALPATTKKISSSDSCFVARDNTSCHVVVRLSIHNGEISLSVRATSFARNRKQPHAVPSATV